MQIKLEFLFLLFSAKKGAKQTDSSLPRPWRLCALLLAYLFDRIIFGRCANDTDMFPHLSMALGFRVQVERWEKVRVQGGQI